MIELKKEELLEINGGVNWSAALFNSAARAIETIMDVGRSLGSAIRRLTNGNICPL